MSKIIFIFGYSFRDFFKHKNNKHIEKKNYARLNDLFTEFYWRSNFVVKVPQFGFKRTRDKHSLYVIGGAFKETTQTD